MSGVAKQFLWLDGKTSGVIQGECRVREFEDWIEIDDWAWGLVQEKAKEGGVTQAVPSPITFGKTTDRATTKMLHAMAKGEKLHAIIRLEEMAAEQFALEIVLKDVQILDYSLDVKDLDKSNEATENWKFDYQEISFVVSGTEATDGEIVTTLKRPVWGSKESPAGSEEKKAKEMLKLAESLSTKKLQEIWDQIKKSWKHPNEGGGGGVDG